MKISQLTNWQLLAIAIIINIVITSIGVFLSNLNFLQLERVSNRTEETAENAYRFKLIQLSHQKTTEAIERATINIGIALNTINETQRQIAELTNDIFIMQKSELEQRKSLGQFLAVVAANNNITIPEELRERLFISNAMPKQSAPPNY